MLSDSGRRVKRTFRRDETKNELAALLEGYLFGLGEVCHTLFGPRGELAMYRAVGNYFLTYLDKQLGIRFTESDPWLRYCRIVEVFTRFGFYGYVELEERGENAYWMLETEQYAARVWEQSGAWQRGTPPCPLWSVILFSLSQIGHTIVLDDLRYNGEVEGFESTFHFEPIPEGREDVIENARRELRTALLPICSLCKRVRDIRTDKWEEIDTHLIRNHEILFSHSLCPDCAAKLYPDM